MISWDKVIHLPSVPLEAGVTAEPELIRVDGLGKDYGGGHGVAEVTLRLGRGEVLGFVGPNGAGKTTSLRMLAGLLRPGAGSGTVMGKDIRKMTRGSDDVGYMPQKLALYADLTVADNLRFRADIYRLPEPERCVARALAAFGLHDRRQQRAGHLSGGWARRLQLAAALIHAPAVILLDEPTAGLDSESREDVWRRIRSLADEGAGIIVNTHDLLEAERCSRVALFRGGRIVRQGTPAELAESAPLRVLLVQSADAEGVRGVLTHQPSVLSMEPHGRRLRVLVTDAGLDTICARLAAAGATVAEDETRLADVALLNERNAMTEMPAA
jgi:ABC-2 type transport system ATP-binding protein